MPSVNWSGFSFEVYNPYNTDWYDVGGVYLFTGIDPLLNQWRPPLYIGRTDSFHNRIPSHGQWFRAVLLGATHVHAMVVPQEATQAIVERLLIALYQPVLNVQHRSLANYFVPPPPPPLPGWVLGW